MSSRWAVWRADVARIVPIAWPVFVGQLAVFLFTTIDTVLVGRYAASDLAAFAVGASAYITVFIGLMGVVLAIGPIVGQLFGAERLEAAGEQLHQAVWVALGLSLLGSALLAFPAPFLWLAQASPEMAAKVRGYLLALAFSLPAALLFTAYRGFNVAVSRPKAVMVLQLGGLALKVPLSAALVFGAGPLPALGVVGCGVATCIAMWAQALIAWQVVRRDPFYAGFRIGGRGLSAPDWRAIGAQLRLGVPMGLSVAIEVTGFVFMAFFIARVSETAVAGHQVATNVVATLFMLSMALANGTSTLVAQRIGAGDLADARRLGWHGLEFTALLALVLGCTVFALRAPIARLYTGDAAVIAAALPLLAWVALFHLFDAVQITAAFVLRAWRVATVPVLIYAASVWGVGLGGGYVLGFNTTGTVPASMQGAPGYWLASTAGLALAGIALTLFLRWFTARQCRP
ncbi:MAG TPA: MATE family efflux transporter [Burkholderiaceae bacterium]|nr:MATE family efflux transporter [Burkholderiaceae bacterium]